MLINVRTELMMMRNYLTFSTKVMGNLIFSRMISIFSYLACTSSVNSKIEKKTM